MGDDYMICLKMKIWTDTVISEAAYDPKHIKTPTHLIK
jgi:hypothetical protein